MLNTLVSSITLTSFLTFGSLLQSFISPQTLLAEKQISLENRQPVKLVNDVFKDNILLNLAFLKNSIPIRDQKLAWDLIRSDQHYEFKLNPGQTFAYHEDSLPEYQGKVIQTTNAHFNAQEGFLSDGYLVGDGVCHFASLINWASQDAGLEVKAPTNHDFAVIPEIPRQYGTSIYSYPGRSYSNQVQNLYVTNNTPRVITFHFDYKNSILKVKIYGSTQKVI